MLQDTRCMLQNSNAEIQSQPRMWHLQNSLQSDLLQGRETNNMYGQWPKWVVSGCFLCQHSVSYRNARIVFINIWYIVIDTQYKIKCSSSKIFSSWVNKWILCFYFHRSFQSSLCAGILCFRHMWLHSNSIWKKRRFFRVKKSTHMSIYTSIAPSYSFFLI